MKGSPERKNEILECARSEFLKKGYEQASLRDICAKAGVTTGAMYFYFKNKAELFDTLVRDIAIKMQSLIEEQLRTEVGEKTSERGDKDELLKYLMDNRAEILLLCNKSKGTKYEGYLRRVEDQLTEYLHQRMEALCGKKVEKDVARIIARMRLSSYETIISKQYTYEQAADIADSIKQYASGGFNSLLDALKAE